MYVFCDEVLHTSARWLQAATGEWHRCSKPRPAESGPDHAKAVALRFNTAIPSCPVKNFSARLVLFSVIDERSSLTFS